MKRRKRQQWWSIAKTFAFRWVYVHVGTITFKHEGCIWCMQVLDGRTPDLCAASFVGAFWHRALSGVALQQYF